VNLAIMQSLARNRLLVTASVAHLALSIALLAATMFDPTLILGVSRWLKPMKFAISIAIYTGTMAWLLSKLQESARPVRHVSQIVASTMTAEMLLITMQSVRGVRSHFNDDSPFDTAVFVTMGVLIVMNTIAAAYTAYLFFARPAVIDRAMLAGVRLGLLIFLLASLEGGLMIARGSHSVGADDGGSGLPIVNWSTEAGDLRVAHFFAMHALQGLPLLAWSLERRSLAKARFWVNCAGCLVIVLTILLVAQALTGHPAM